MTDTNDETQTDEKVEQRPEPVNLEGFASEVAYLRGELEKVRKEAAKYRTERNEVREQMKGMTSLEEFQSLQTKLDEMEHKAQHDALVSKYANVLPEAIRKSINWPEDEQSIKAKVEELSEFAVQSPGTNANPSGGLGDRGQVQDDEFDPAALAAQIPR